ncbi:peptidoglycan-binding protein [Patescibacteria group bacterium]|nr:peptidoglycan-binding protein [Patescibacteria group bacterium]
MILKHGVIHDEVSKLQDKLNRAGFHAGAVDRKFFGATDRAVRECQRALGLRIDGQVGVGNEAGETIKALDKLLANATTEIPTAAIDTFDEVMGLPYSMPVTNFDRRIADFILLQQRVHDGQGCRYGGWINPYLFDKKEFDDKKLFVVPKVGRIVPGVELIKPVHGGTCSPWLSMQLGVILCANEDYNFRIGRSAYQIANFDHDQVYKNTTIPGFSDYCEVHGKRRLERVPMNVLYERWAWLNKINMVEMDHHCIAVLKVGGPDGLNLPDPRFPDQALTPGLYRWSADGYYPRKDTDGDGEMEKFYSGTRQTFRRITKTEKCDQGWDIYRVTDMDPVTCAPTDGPWAGRKPWPLVLEA